MHDTTTKSSYLNVIIPVPTAHQTNKNRLTGFSTFSNNPGFTNSPVCIMRQTNNETTATDSAYERYEYPLVQMPIQANIRTKEEISTKQKDLATWLQTFASRIISLGDVCWPWAVVGSATSIAVDSPSSSFIILIQRLFRRVRFNSIQTRRTGGEEWKIKDPKPRYLKDLEWLGWSGESHIFICSDVHDKRWKVGVS